MPHSPDFKVKNELSPRKTCYIDRADLVDYLHWKFGKGEKYNYGVEVGPCTIYVLSLTSLLLDRQRAMGVLDTSEGHLCKPVG
jgi:hypothetical protein